MHGLLLSKIEDSDFKFTSGSFNKTLLPVEYKNEEFINNIPIKNQGSYPICVSSGGSYIREYQEYKQTGVFNRFSQTFRYIIPEDIDRDYDGMSIKDYLNCLLKYGDVYNADFPYLGDYAYLKQKYTENINRLREKALKNRISAYFYINPKDIDDIKAAILTFGAVQIAVCTYNIFSSGINNSYQLQIPDPYEDVAKGGHNLTLVGWDRYGNWVSPNTWGTTWGNKGYVKIPMVYPIEEAWGIFDGVLDGDSKLEIKFGTTSQPNFLSLDNLEESYGVLKFLNKHMAYISRGIVYNNKIVLVRDELYNSYAEAKSKCEDGNVVVPIIYNKDNPDLVLNPFKELIDKDTDFFLMEGLECIDNADGSLYKIQLIMNDNYRNLLNSGKLGLHLLTATNYLVNQIGVSGDRVMLGFSNRFGNVVLDSDYFFNPVTITGKGIRDIAERLKNKISFRVVKVL